MIILLNVSKACVWVVLLLGSVQGDRWLPLSVELLQEATQAPDDSGLLPQVRSGLFPESEHALPCSRPAESVHDHERLQEELLTGRTGQVDSFKLKDENKRHTFK